MPNSNPFPPGTPWLPGRPARQPDGPPGLAALLDAERSVLRELHARMGAVAEAQAAVQLRELALEDAVRAQHDAQRRATRGMRDRWRARELDQRLVTADARSTAAAAKSTLEAAQLRLKVVEQRLTEVRGFVDSQLPGPNLAVEAARRTAELPPHAELFPTISAFIVADPARAVGDPRQQDLVGEALGDRWQLEEPGRPWTVTHWRARLRPLEGGRSELYAVEHSRRPSTNRRVWLLGSISVDPASRAQIDGLVARQHERNSVAALAAATVA